MNESSKRLLRRFLPRSHQTYRIRGGPLAGAKIVTSWHDYPAAILGYAEKALAQWLLDHVKPGETWLDVGAHYGYTSLAMCRQVGATGRVFAFEPSLSSAGCIARTRLANEFWWLTVCPFGLDASPMLASQELPWVRGMIDSQVPVAEADGTERFLSVALDVVWGGLSGAQPRIDGVKIDVQGMELQTLRGMATLLRRWRPRLIVEVHPGVSRKELLDLLGAAGYSLRTTPIEPGPTDFHDPDSNHSFLFEAEGERPSP